MAAVVTTSPVLDEAVNDFKATFSGNPGLITDGQFQLTDAVYRALDAAVYAEFRSVGQAGELLAIYRMYAALRTDATAARVTGYIKRNRLEAEYPRTLKAFSPDPSATPFWAKAAYDAYWHNSGIPSPLVISSPTVAKAKAAYAQEASACYDTSTWFARKWIKARGFPARLGAKAVHGLIGRATLKTLGGGRQIVQYDRAALSDDVDRIDNTLAAGVAVVLGVLSGDNHTNVGRKFPNPEHFLLLLSGDGAGKYVFWDSDATTSNIHSLTWGRGFGLLHYNRYHPTGMFSTAVDPADLMNVSNNFHNEEGFRHCYQAYLVVPVTR